MARHPLAAHVRGLQAISFAACLWGATCAADVALAERADASSNGVPHGSNEPVGVSVGALGGESGDEVADAISLPEVVALGDGPAPESSPALKSIAPSNAALNEPTSFVTPIARTEGDSATPADLAARAPGVMVRDQGFNQPMSISLRGASSEQVTVMLDGLPLNGLAGGGFDLGTLPSAFVERLSVARGANGARYGAGTLGGAVDVEFIEPREGERRLFGELGYGSFLSFDGSLGAALGWTRTALLVSAHARSSRGDYPFLYDPKPLVADNALVERRRDNNDSRRLGLLARVSHRGRARLELLLEADGGIRGIPGAVQAPTLTAEQRDARVNLVGKVSGEVGGFEMEGKLGARLGWLNWAPDRGVDEPWQREHLAFGEFTARRFFDWHALEVSARLGHEGLSGEAHGVHDRIRASLFASDEIEIGPATIHPALRGEFVGARFGLSPKLGLSLEVVDGISLRGNVGRSFRPPSFGELYLEQGSISPNPDLEPETALFADLGIEARRSPIAQTPLHLRGAAAGFVTRYGEVILYELNAPMRIKPFNLGQAIVWGGEFEVEAALTLPLATLRLNGAYTLSFSRNQSGDERYDGRELPFHPRHRAVGRLEADIWRLNAFAAVEFQSRQLINRSNTDAIDARTRCDFGLAALLHRPSGLKLSAELKNAFNARGQDLYGYPHSGRDQPNPSYHRNADGCIPSKADRFH